MKEFVEKLNEKLYENVKSNSCPSYSCWEHSNKNCDKCNLKKIMISDVIEIVNQLAEEYDGEELRKLQKVYNFITREINPYGKPFEGTVYEFGLKVMKYIRNLSTEEYNNGWIPCEKKLPETNESVLCWAKSTARGGDVCFVGSYHKGFWFLQSSANTHSFPGQYKIVAWQKLPEPFKPIAE